jgi:hypothetical protein
MIAIICGTSGLVGRILVEKLLNHDHINKVVSVTRKSIILLAMVSWSITSLINRFWEKRVDRLTDLNNVKFEFKKDYSYAQGETVH